VLLAKVEAVQAAAEKAMEMVEEVVIVTEGAAVVVGNYREHPRS